MEFSDNNLIGQGGNWKIYRVDEGLRTIIIRVPKSYSNKKVDSYLENYYAIKKTGLPTLNRLDKHIYKEREIIITEDLNSDQEYIYVTPNSLISDSQKKIHEISQSILGNDRELNGSPEAEAYRYRNKLQEIVNFEAFFGKVKDDLRQVAKHRILVDFDAYFFGTRKKSTYSEISYKIADLDNIYTNLSSNTSQLYKFNLLEFKRSILQFTRYFIADGLFKNTFYKAINEM
jgi:hypothetical protein